ncbi:MAG: bifunctional 5,10-methylene-tetrahydrofolate dehydrogenase/5,10-methylene-tetrahydrofolate cyclohydrolase [Bacteroidetes bacterium]|nr:bifunctional 5,10-methylene-tetrahydrofolate dehydrogenase/5,10-methylene-tetrahydrofolate cyclohydrolase [Bacteroidota bacterium]
MYTLIDGKATAAQIHSELSMEVQIRLSKGLRPPHLAAVLVGHDGASQTYVNNKILACERVGFQSTLIRKEATTTESELLELVASLNQDKDLDGFIVQLPLPDHINPEKINEAIDPAKDVDGFHAINLGRMLLNLPGYLPATPAGIIELLRRYNIETEGKNCVILGRSHIVGSPLSVLMARSARPGNCTVTLCHSKTQKLKEHIQRADILIAALGKPGFVQGEWVKEGAVVIDVGTTRVPDASRPSGYKLMGDVDFETAAPRCSAITPVPGGVGPMTISMLLRNTLDSANKRHYGG